MAENTENKVRGKVIVLTGASSGIGKGTALELAGMGANLVLAARRENLLEELVQQCQKLGGQAIAVPTDVSKQQDMEQLAQTALATFGRIDVWINDAGASVIGRFEDAPIEEHVQVIETDLIGTIYGSHLALRQFRQQPEGGILINIASVLGKLPAPYQASYVAAKYGVVGLCATLRQELKVNNVENIHVCTVMPMSIDTPFFEHAADYSGHKAVPIPPVYDAQEVIQALAALVTNPKDEVAVGGLSAPASVMLHQIAPALVESGMAQHTHRQQMEEAPPAEDKPGNLAEPTPVGTNVGGGWKQSK